MTTDIERGGIDVGGSHEPSYYEIALTNRQVVVAFVILLTCVVAAFFSGVWIGRESAARAQERLALLGRGRVLEGANADADKGKEGQALQEFKFFADSRQHPDAGAKVGKNVVGTTGARGTPAAAPLAADRGDQETPAARGTSARPAVPADASAAAGGDAGSPSRRSTLAEDLGRRTGSSAAQAGATASPAAPGTAAGKRTRRDGATPSIPPSQAAQATPVGDAAGEAGEGEPLRGKAAIRWSPAAGAPASGAGASPASPAGAAATATAGEVVIQVFSTADKEQADKVRDGLVHAGFTAFLSPIAKGGQTMYRVRIGPFPSRTAAEPVAEKIRKERKLDTWITPK
jgi:cell division protein FtsN